MRSRVLEAFDASTEQSGSGLLGALFITAKFVYHVFTERGFWTETLEARLRFRSTTRQVNLAA